MNHIVLINGTYGIGKTTVAKLLSSNRCNYYFLDPDERYNELIDKGFEYLYGWPMQRSWRYLNELREIIDERINKSNLIIPMTISCDICKNVLFDYLYDNFKLIHVILYADNESLIYRIESDEGRSKDFAKGNIDTNDKFFKMNFADAIWIDTSNKAAESVANIISVKIG